MTTYPTYEHPKSGRFKSPHSIEGMGRSKRTIIRNLIFILLWAVTCSTQTGCQLFDRFRRPEMEQPIVYEETPTQQQMLETINDRNQRTRQLNTNVSLTIPGAPSKLKGTIQVEYPNRLRMKAGLLGMSELGVDVGSNEEQFWIWSKAPGQEQAIYYADYESYQQSAVRQAIPVDPQWLIEAIGLVDFDPSDVHYGPAIGPHGRLKLTTIQQTPTGPQIRETYIGATSGLIERQVVYDSSNRLIAYSDSSHYKNYPQDHVSLPQRIELHMIQPDGSDTEVIVEFGSFSVNSLYGDPDKMWSMPNALGVPKIDLAQLPNPTTGLGQAQ